MLYVEMTFKILVRVALNSTAYQTCPRHDEKRSSVVIHLTHVLLQRTEMRHVNISPPNIISTLNIITDLYKTKAIVISVSRDHESLDIVLTYSL